MKKVLLITITILISYYSYADGGFLLGSDKIRTATNQTWVVSTTPPTVYAGDWMEGEIWLWYQDDPGLGAQFRYTTDNWTTIQYDLFSRGNTSGNDVRYSNQGSSIGPWIAGTEVKYQIQSWGTWWNPHDKYTTESNFTVTALPNPTSQTAAAASSTSINLAWAQWNTKDVMIVRRLTSAAVSDAPIQGNAYTVGATLGTGTVVFNGSGTSYVNTGLSSGTSYTYTFYSVNNNYYSAGVAATAITSQTTAATDYFRSKATGSWNAAGTWESSVNNVNWITSTLVPTSLSASITILSEHTVTLSISSTANNLTVNGTLMCNTLDMEVSSSLTNNGYFIFGESETVTIGENGVLTNNGILDSKSGAFLFSGAGTISGTINFNNVIIAGSVNFGANSTITGILYITTGGIVTTPPTYASTSILTYATETTYARGAEWSATSGAGYPYSVQISENTTLNMGANSGTATPRQCAGDLIIDAGSGFSMDITSMTAAVTVLGDVENHGTITLSSTNGGNLITHGNFTSTPVNANVSTINFVGANTQTLSNYATLATTATSIPFIIINKSAGEVRLNRPLSCIGSGNALVIDGINSYLNLNGKKLTLGSNAVASTYNNGISQPGFITASGGLITINGTGDLGTIYFDQRNPDVSSNILSTLTINRTSSGTVTIGNNLTVSSTCTTTSGTIIIPSGVSFIQSSAGVNATMDITMNNADWTNWKDGWHHISSPVAAQAISPAFTTTPETGYDFYAWWELTNQWINYKNTTVAPTWNTANDNSANFRVGYGYLAAYDEAGTKTFAGTLNVADVTRSGLVVTGSTQTNRSWHLMGNPFSSALSWDGTWTNTNIAGVAQIWNESIQDYSELTSSPASIIPATNGFMVQSVSATEGSLTIPAAKRVHSAQAFYKSADVEIPQIKLLASTANKQSAKQSSIMLYPDATEGYDLMYDGEFLHGFGPSFYSQQGDLKLSLNALPELTAESIIPFVFIKNDASDFTIEFKQGIEGYTIYLKDLKSNTDHNLSADSVYAFTSFEGDDPNRFLLHFKQTTGVSDEVDDQKLEFVYSNGALYLSGLETDAEIRVTNMLGQVVLSRFATGTDVKELNTSGLSKGVYILSVLTGSQKKSGKFVVR